MNARHRAFAECYALTQNATKAAIEAGFSPRTAHSQGHRLLKNAEIQALIQELQERASSERIADLDEIKEFWTRIMRSDEERTLDKIKASELLAKVEGGFVERVAIDTSDREDVVIYLPSNGREPCKEEDDAE